jgi:hypothetical protein
LLKDTPTGVSASSSHDVRLREIANQAVEPGPNSVQEKLDELRAFAISRLNRLPDVLANPEAIYEARALLAERNGKFTLERVSAGGQI